MLGSLGESLLLSHLIISEAIYGHIILILNDPRLFEDWSSSAQEGTLYDPPPSHHHQFFYGLRGKRGD